MKDIKIKGYVLSAIVVFFVFGWIIGSYRLGYSFIVVKEIESLEKNEKWISDLRESFHGNEMEIENLDLNAILDIENIYLRNARLEEYVKAIPLNEMRTLFDKLSLRQTELLQQDGLDYWEKVILQTPLFIWLARDFEEAKAFIIEKIDVTQQSSFFNAIFVGALFRSWMNKNSDECFKFVFESREDYWKKSFMNGMPFSFPKEVFLFMRQNADANNALSVFSRPYLFTAWYSKNPREALETAASLRGEERKLAYNGIIREMMIDHPYEAIEIINEEWSGAAERQPLLEQAIRTLTMTNPDESLSIILQDRFQEEDFVVVYRSFASCLAAEQLRIIIDNQGNKLSKGEREELIIQHLAGQIGINGIYFGNELGEEEINAKLSLLTSLKEADQVTAIKGMVASQDAELALKAYQLLPEKEKSITDQYQLLERLVKKNPSLAAQYYGEYLAGNEIVGDKGFSKEMMQMKNSMALSGIVDAFYDDDAEATVAWITTLPSEKLRDEATVRIVVRDAVTNPLGALAYLEGVKDLNIGKNGFLNMTQSLANEDPKALVQVLLHAKHEDWAENAVTYSMYQVARISEDYTLNFIDDLADNPKLQNDARKQYVNILERENPKQALDIALEMIPGKETDLLIEKVFNSFSQKDPEGAKQWMIENGIKR